MIVMFKPELPMIYGYDYMYSYVVVFFCCLYLILLCYDAVSLV